MILKKLRYSRNRNELGEWVIEGANSHTEDDNWLVLNQINLIVGRNASGKTRTLNTIRQISDFFGDGDKTSELIYNTATYELSFIDDAEEIEYYLDFKDGLITQEILKINGEEKLNRQQEKLFYEKAQAYLEFEFDADILAASRRNARQQPFFEKLYKWGKGLHHYSFGDTLGQKTAIKDINKVDLENWDINLKDNDVVIPIFMKGQLLDKFNDTLISDMKKIDYSITDIDINRLNIRGLPTNSAVLHVQESELSGMTSQIDMSQGMFRVLSLLVQINYALSTKIPSCILIDDIGEGLDYARTKQLIELLISKIKGSSVQLIMTTNDQFVMNKVPLEYWSIIKRETNKAVLYNYQNSKKAFDDFDFTGLDNFSFFSSNYYQRW